MPAMLNPILNAKMELLSELVIMIKTGVEFIITVLNLPFC